MMPSNPPKDDAARQAALEAAQSRPFWRTRSAGESTAQAGGRETPLAFAYLRVSTKEQARTGGGIEGYSIPAQRGACLAKAAQLSAVIEREYVDAGESARSADRDQLQQMLRDIKTLKPDFVIVHKIDRLARNREDDIAINLLLRKNGVKLVSCTENIDDTPSGRLLYGLMAEIAQFYSGNLAQEVMKGLLRKAEEGGTPYRAPLGYLNVRKTVNGVTFAAIDLDPQRAELIRWCFEMYATGDWAASDLLLEATKRGLTSRPSAKVPEREIGLTTMYHVLANPYYMGVVSYQGIHYEGKHQPLVEPDVWLAVQDVLAAHQHKGEKDRKHTHYLRSTIFCSRCCGRLVYSENVGNGGAYQYFVCVKKKTRTNNCRRPAVRLERIEAGIAQFYGRFQIRPERVEQIRAGVRSELATQQAEALRGVAQATKRKAQLTDERQKLLQAHYAGAIPADLLGSEMKRLTWAMAEADTELAQAKTTTTDLEAVLEAALKAAANCQQAYLSAPDHVRRQINQGFFKRLLIGDDGCVERYELTEPFAALLATESVIQTITDKDTDGDVPARHVMRMSQMTARPLAVVGARGVTSENDHPVGAIWATANEVATVTKSENDVTVRDVVLYANGVHNEYLVGRVGLEPTANGL